ncbi:hypothetical protein PHK61_15665 [Actinomycetospora lutea]|uniref:hypothetical protein n=1 Tax=Actinomycetospora lutea TaxID=663604 RepID=UPI00236593F3|nr:hypothetical protein [Actinomycetospora lutea]MDD7939857.1 hypothetical protein [Actinomycetospora lutea]
MAHRLWFVLVAAPLCLTGLLLVATDLSRTVLIVGAAAYFVGHFAYLTPYEALYPDLVPKEVSGRSRTAASSWRFAGLGAALVGGGFLLDLWAPAVFLVAAGAVAIGTVALLAGLWSSRREPLAGAAPSSGGLRAVVRLAGPGGRRRPGGDPAVERRAPGPQGVRRPVLHRRARA